MRDFEGQGFERKHVGQGLILTYLNPLGFGNR